MFSATQHSEIMLPYLDFASVHSYKKILYWDMDLVTVGRDMAGG